MQLQAINSFITVYETENITRASEKLYITQQCISKHIKCLETELGVKLFERRKSGMVPTEICRKIYPDIKKSFLGYDRAVKACQTYNAGFATKLNIAVASGLSNYININALTNIIENSTGYNLSLEEFTGNESREKLFTGEADMALLLEPFDDTMLEHTLIAQDYGCIAVTKNSPLAEETGPISFSRLDGLKTVIGPKTNCVTEHFERYCRQAGIFPQYVVSVADLNGYINNMSDEDVVAMMLSRTSRMITNPNVVIRPVVDPVLLGKCHFCFRMGAERADLYRKLMNEIKSEFEEYNDSSADNII